VSPLPSLFKLIAVLLVNQIIPPFYTGSDADTVFHESLF